MYTVPLRRVSRGDDNVCSTCTLYYELGQILVNSGPCLADKVGGIELLKGKKP